jgi:hypothetical protein
LPRIELPFPGEALNASSKGVTPSSLLIRTHAPVPLDSPLLRFLASFEESLQVFTRPCCPRDFPDVIICISFLGCLIPYPGCPTKCIYLFLPSCHRPSPRVDWVGFQLFPRRRLYGGNVSRLQIFLYVQTSEFACFPDRPHRCVFRRRAAEALTSEQNMLRCLRMHRIC